MFHFSAQLQIQNTFFFISATRIRGVLVETDHFSKLKHAEVVSFNGNIQYMYIEYSKKILNSGTKKT